MTEPQSWIPVWLVAEVSGALSVIERTGHAIEGSGDWAVNMRDSSCRSKLIAVVEERYVHRTREAAEARLREVQREMPKGEPP